MKKIFAFLLALCLMLSLCACGGTAPVQTPTEATTTIPTTSPTNAPAEEYSISPLLYKVTDAEGNTAWLFGSIHVGQDHFYPLPDYVTGAYENSDALAVEADMVTFNADLEAQTQALMKLVYLDGTTIKDHIPEDLYTKAVDAMTQCGIYMSAFDMYYPVLWSNLLETAQLQNLDADSTLGIDMHFLNDAHNTGKEIQEVESADFQYGMMAGFSEALQIELLESALYTYENSDELETELFELMDAWTTGDADTLVTLLNEDQSFENDEEAQLYAEYTDAMITQRNITMADFAEDALRSGKEVFICVGAAHVVGPGAMADLLTQRGYIVELIQC